VEKLLIELDYIGHIRPRGEETRQKRRFKPRRWVVEVAHSWFNRFRKLVPRYEKTASSCVALHKLAAAIICFRMAGIG
jgi:transposase